MKYPHLFQPLLLGTLELKNRIAFTSIGIDSYNQQGTVTDENLSFIRARSKETGLIITTVSTASYKYGHLKFIGSYDDSFIPSLRRFARAGHAGSAKVFLQLFVMGGPNTLADDVFQDVIPYVPSAEVPLYREWAGKNTPRELENWQIKHLVDENTWLAGMLSARMGKETTHEQNVKIARRFVREHYHELWEAVHRDRACNTWPANGSLEAMIADR